MDKCNDVLQGDLNNKINSKSEKSQFAQKAAAEFLYQKSESEAYELYKAYQANTKSEQDSGSLEGSYMFGVASGEGSFSHAYARDLSRDEFKSTFNKNKAEYKKESTSSSSSQSNLIDIYSSSVRDERTIKAWETCMRTRSAGEGLIAYGHRDASGNPYVTVLWVPGDMIAVMPSVNVKFLIPHSNVEIEGAGKETVIATGSGTAFGLRYKDPKDKKARSDGFSVLVNGQVKNESGKVVQSYQVSAAVPRNFTDEEHTNLSKVNLAGKAMPSEKGSLVNAHSGLCLTVAGGVTDKNTAAVQYLCDGHPSRSWNLTAEGTDTVKITNSNSGLCLSIEGGGTGKNITAIQSGCGNDASQRWRYTKVDDSTFRLVNINSSLCLTIAGGGKDKNTTAVQYPCDGDPSRDWKFRAAP